MRFQIYPDAGGAYRWRIVARNGRKVAVSGEAFDSKWNAERALRDFCSHVGRTVVIPELVEEVVETDEPDDIEGAPA